MPVGRWAGLSFALGSRRSIKKQKEHNNDPSSSNNSPLPSSSSSFNNMHAFTPQQPWTAESVASLPPPGLSGPSQIVFTPIPPAIAQGNVQTKQKRLLAFVSSPSTVIRTARSPPAIFRPLTTGLYPTPSNKQPPVNVPQPPAVSAAYAAAYNQQLAAMAAQNGMVMPASHAPSLIQHPHAPQPAPVQPQQLQGAPACVPQERVLLCMDLTDVSTQLTPPQPLLRLNRQSKRRLIDSSNSFSGSDTPSQDKINLEERLRRERQRLSASAGTLTQFSWTWCERKKDHGQGVEQFLRVLIPSRGSLYVQDDVLLPPPPLDYEQNSQETSVHDPPRCIHDKSTHSPAVDPQLSPDGSMVAWTADGEIYIQSCGSSEAPVDKNSAPVQLSFGAIQTSEAWVRHGVADFVAQEEMDRYRGFWWHPDSTGILLVRLDESNVPPFRILHHDAGNMGNEHDPYHRPMSSAIPYEDHRYPFAGKDNPKIELGYVRVDRESIIRNGTTPSPLIHHSSSSDSSSNGSMDMEEPPPNPAQELARENWARCLWFDSPREASEYLARIHWLPDGSVVAQWQNRTQNVSVLTRLDLYRGKSRTLLTERSDVWINLHHMFKVLPDPIHPDDCIPTEKLIPPMPNPLPEGSFSFLYASERSGYQHLYLYTFAPGIHGEQAVLLRAVSSGEWMVESIVGVDVEKDAVYITGTFDSPLERHLYAIPMLNRRLLTQDQSNLNSIDELSSSQNGVRRGISKVMHALSGKTTGRNGRVQEALWASMRPVRLTIEAGMHSIVMDDECRIFVDTSSDLDRPTSTRIYGLPDELWAPPGALSIKLVYTLFDAVHEDNWLVALGGNHQLDGLQPGVRLLSCLPPPELISFPTSDGAETLHAALYRPNPRIYGPGPYPLVCAVYGGPHVQRVNRSWSQCADMRAQRLRSLGFCVVKCDNRGSSRRGMAFESSVSRKLGRLEVLDQVAAVRHLALRGVVDSSRVGVYGWSYGGYLAAMCLCRAPDVFSCAVAGAPVTSWDGYDTHYTERYMGHPSENGAGYRESAVFDHVPNMRGKMMIVHGLLDENVHFRHTARLINKLVASGKDYDLLLFPEERHSPRRLRDRIYMEQRISDFFLRQLCSTQPQMDMMMAMGQHAGMRPLGGHL